MAIVLRELPNLVRNKVSIEGPIDNDLDHFIYELNRGVDDGYQLYLNYEIVSSSPLIKQLTNYLDNRGIPYQYIRSKAIS